MKPLPLPPAYYNEIDPYAAQWIRNLIRAGHIAPGVVDERSIEDVKPSDLAPFKQCHFFAGIAVWSHALRLAGVADDTPIWTASCPCQPFSAAGKSTGFDDQRHLWPHLQWLIEQRKPAKVIGEQVASKSAEPWIDLIHTDLEGMGYSFGCVPFPSAGVGAPHIRDRLYWVANSNNERLEGRQRMPERADQCAVRSGSVAGGMGDAIGARIRGKSSNVYSSQTETGNRQYLHDTIATGATSGFWASAEWVQCTDGRQRPVEPGAFPLAHGAPSRVGRLRAYGNAINAQAAKAFIEVAFSL